MSKRNSGGGNPKATAVLIKANKARRFKNEDVFVIDSTYPRHRLKERIIKENMIDYHCSICGTDAIWLGKPMPLILDHINGVNNDNRLENLRFVCSNCDSQLPTYKARNINKNKQEDWQSGRMHQS